MKNLIRIPLTLTLHVRYVLSLCLGWSFTGENYLLPDNIFR